MLSLTLSNLTTTMCAAMPSQTNPTPAPIPPQPRHTLHTLCLHAMCRPIAHHETVQDRLRLDSTSASPVTNSWLTTQPATLHIPLLVASSTPHSCVVQLSSTLTSPPLQRMAMAYPHTCVNTPQLYTSQPRPRAPQPRHTLHTLCLQAMYHQTAHHETAQD